MAKFSYEEQKALLCILNNMTQDQLDAFTETYDGLTDTQKESITALNEAVHEYGYYNGVADSIKGFVLGVGACVALSCVIKGGKMLFEYFKAKKAMKENK